MTAKHTLYRVLMRRRLRSKKEILWNNYGDIDRAIEAASGLVQGGHAAKIRIVAVTEISADDVAIITTTPVIGFPHGRAKVERLK